MAGRRGASLLAGMTRGSGLCSGLYNRSDVAWIRADEHRLAALLLSTVYDWCVVGIGWAVRGPIRGSIVEILLRPHSLSFELSACLAIVGYHVVVGNASGSDVPHTVR
jgi:hypothetical protein